MKPHILLVDDEPNVLFALKRALRKENFEIHTAPSAEDALDVLQKNPIDVIVSDQDMPGMTGTKLLARVKNLYPKVIRFILTGKATLEVAVEAINEGDISRFFMKPCNVTDLVATIREALQKKELMEKAMQLMRKVKTQKELIEEAEKKYPGISEVKRDVEGRIEIEELPVDYQSFILKINKTLGQ